MKNIALGVAASLAVVGGTVWCVKLLQVETLGPPRRPDLLSNTLHTQPDKQGPRRPPVTVLGISVAPDGSSALVLQEDIRQDFHLIDLEFGDWLPNAARGHSGVTTCARLSPDGTRAVSGGADGTVILWDFMAVSRKELQGHQAPVAAVAWSQDGKSVLSASRDKTLKLWEVASGKLLQTLSLTTDPARVALSPNGKWALVANTPYDERGKPNSSSVQVWDTASGKLVRELAGHTRAVTCLSFSADGKQALSGSPDATVRVWLVPTWKEYVTLRATDATNRNLGEHDDLADGVYDAAFTPNGEYVLSAGRGGLLLWEVRSGKAAMTFEGRPRDMEHVAVLGDGRRALTASRSTIVLWDLRTGKEIRTLFGGKLEGPDTWCIAFVQGAKRLISSTEKGATIWELPAGRVVRTLDVLAFSSQSVSEDGTYLLSSKPLGVWDLSAGKSLWRKEQPFGLSALSGDGRQAIGVSTIPPQNTIEHWDAKTGQLLRRLQRAEQAGVLSISLSADGQLALSKTSDQKVIVWDLARGVPLKVLSDPVPAAGAVGSTGEVCFSADGKLVFSSHYVTRIWSVSTGKLVESYEHHGPSLALALRPDGRRFVCVDDAQRRRLQVWEYPAGKLVCTITPVGSGPPRTIRRVVFSPDGRWITLGGPGRLLQVWDVHSGKLVADLGGSP